MNIVVPVLECAARQGMSENNLQFWCFMLKNDVLVAEPLLLDVKTTARMLNVCERTIRTLTKMGELPVVKILGRVLYSREDLVEFVRQRSQRETSSGSE